MRVEIDNSPDIFNILLISRPGLNWYPRTRVVNF